MTAAPKIAPRRAADWQPIETAPKDGSPVRCRREVDGCPMFEGIAAWRTVTFPAGYYGGFFLPEEIATGWMRVDIDKRAPEPTHWLPSAGPGEVARG